MPFTASSQLHLEEKISMQTTLFLIITQLAIPHVGILVFNMSIDNSLYDI